MYVLRIGNLFATGCSLLKCKVRVHRFNAVMNAIFFVFGELCVCFVLECCDNNLLSWSYSILKMVWFQKRFCKMLTRFALTKVVFRCCWVHLGKSCKFVIVANGWITCVKPTEHFRHRNLFFYLSHEMCSSDQLF